MLNVEGGGDVVGGCVQERRAKEACAAMTARHSVGQALGNLAQNSSDGPNSQRTCGSN